MPVQGKRLTHGSSLDTLRRPQGKQLCRLLQYTKMRHGPFCEPRRGFVAPKTAAGLLGEGNGYRDLMGIINEENWAGYMKICVYIAIMRSNLPDQMAKIYDMSRRN